MTVIQETINARNALDVQMKYRTQVAANLNELKEKAKENPSEYLTREISDLEEYLSLCTEKISQMQREIVASDQENMAKSRLENIHTVGEAKLVAQQLFETVGEICKQQKQESLELTEKYEELMESHDEVLMERRKAQLTKTVGLDEHRAVVEAHKATMEELER